MQVICDLACYNGEDIACYLLECDKVVAIEAILCEEVRACYEECVWSERLVIENCVLLSEADISESNTHFFIHKNHQVLSETP